MADLAWLQSESRILKLLLHVTFSEETTVLNGILASNPYILFHAANSDLQVSPLPGAATIRIRHCQVSERIRSRTNSLFVAKQNSHGFLFRAGYPRLLPARRATAFAVLDEQVSASNFVLLISSKGSADARSVMIRHVHLELVRVGSFWRLPSRFFGIRVEVVGQVLRVGDADLPWLRQAGFFGPTLRWLWSATGSEMRYIHGMVTCDLPWLLSEEESEFCLVESNS
jgi:hypothetical protein